MKTKTIMLCTIALTLGGHSAYAESFTSNSGPRYTPRPEISQNNYTQENRAEDRMDTKSYNQYEQREPCQNYRKPPRNYVDSCTDKVIEEDIIEEDMAVAVMPAYPENIISSYTVLFDFDKSGIRSNETATLDRAMREIDEYQPTYVTVTGYTDSAGDVTYNQTLSRQREQAVSSALLTRGIENQVLDREARGEYSQAVETADGVRNQENRRVVIDFRR